MKKSKKAFVKNTGEKIKVIYDSGFWRDERGIVYFDTEITFIEKHDISLGLHLLRLGIFLYAREYIKYNSWFIIPGITIDIVNGFDYYIDIEVKILCFGFGIRFIWIKNWRFKYPFWRLFKKS